MFLNAEVDILAIYEGVNSDALIFQFFAFLLELKLDGDSILTSLNFITLCILPILKVPFFQFVAPLLEWVLCIGVQHMESTL